VLSLDTLAATNGGERKMPAPTTMPTVIATASFSDSVGIGSPTSVDRIPKLFAAIETKPQLKEEMFFCLREV
jgi:hypothetical protein